VRALVLFGAATAAGRRPGRYYEVCSRRLHVFTTSPRSSRCRHGALAHLAVEKGDKLGTVIVDCAR
jgi:hypothetical protein